MRTIKTVNLNFAEQFASLVLDDDYSFDISFNELKKLQLQPNLDNQPSFTKVPGVTVSVQNYTEAVELALKQGIITVNNALVISDYTSKGYANIGIPEDSNLILQEYPAYWTFLQQLRQDRNDPHLV